MVLAFVLACSSPPAETSGTAPWRLTFVSDLNIATGTPTEELGTVAEVSAPPAARQDLSTDEILRRKSSGEFGGLSAITYDATEGLLYALSDSSKPVFFVLPLAVEDGRLELSAGRPTFLTGVNGEPLPAWSLDPEGIALSSRRTLYVASEGYPARQPPVDAGILEFGLDGRMLRRIPVPAGFLSSTEGSAPNGVRHNVGFEGLTLTPDGTRMFAATEGPLVQDTPPCGIGKGCVGRIIEYTMSGPVPAPVREYAYSIGALSIPEDFRGASGDNGVSEILALSGQELLILERGFALDSRTRRGFTRIRIYYCTLDGASDVSGVPSLRDTSAYQPTSKTLLLDLATVTDQFSPGFRSLDNFEGMCFGPPFPNGDRSVILVSDNNYREHQRTALLIFRLAPN